MPAGWKEKIATIEMNSVKASINEDRKTWGLSCDDDDDDDDDNKEEEDKEKANNDPYDNDADDNDADDNDDNNDNPGLCRAWAKWNMMRAQSPKRWFFVSFLSYSQLIILILSSQYF